MMKIFLSTDRFSRFNSAAPLLAGRRLTFAIMLCLIAGSTAAFGDTGKPEQPEARNKPFKPDMGKVFPEAESSELVAVGRPESAIRDNVAIACGSTEVRHLIERCRAADDLGTGFNTSEIKLMLDFLDKKLADQSEYKSLGFNAIKNNVSWALLHQSRPVESYCNALVAMYRNQEHDYVWKDYCIQHMALYCAGLKRGDSDSNPAVLYGVLASLDDAVKQIRLPICGTALVGMKNMSGLKEMDGDVNVGDTALKVAENPEACNAARATALQIAVEMRSAGILKVARDLARNSEDVMLRTSAINAVGKAGSGEDAALLMDLSTHGDSRISLSARRAVKSLQLRISPTVSN